MGSIYIENYELINGFALVDNNFSIITANENMYKFLGISTHYSIMDAIHQVDLDDFIDVANTLRMDGVKKTVCIRMKRVDNSYRWVLVDIVRKCIDNREDTEYLELNVSDVLALRNYNKSLQTTIRSFTHIMAMDNELFYTYDYDTEIFVFYTFVDNELFILMKDSIKNIRGILLEKNDIAKESLFDFDCLIEDIIKGKSEYTYNLNTRVFRSKDNNYALTQIKGSTIFSERKPVKTVGSFKYLNCEPGIYNQKTYDYGSLELTTTQKDLEDYCIKNTLIDPNCNLSLIWLEIDNLSDYTRIKGQKAADEIFEQTKDTILKVIEYRGIMCAIDSGIFAIVLKNTNAEVSLRAFLEHIRTKISWSCRILDSDYKIKFSIGIARFPENGTDFSIITKKLQRACAIAKEKGGNRYIIYKEAIHGDIE